MTAVLLDDPFHGMPQVIYQLAVEHIGIATSGATCLKEATDDLLLPRQPRCCLGAASSRVISAPLAHVQHGVDQQEHRCLLCAEALRRLLPHRPLAWRLLLGWRLLWLLLPASMRRLLMHSLLSLTRWCLLGCHLPWSGCCLLLRLTIFCLLRHRREQPWLCTHALVWDAFRGGGLCMLLQGSPCNAHCSRPAWVWQT
jgi:hypothetical protein